MTGLLPRGTSLADRPRITNDDCREFPAVTAGDVLRAVTERIAREHPELVVWTPESGWSPVADSIIGRRTS